MGLTRHQRLLVIFLLALLVAGGTVYLIRHQTPWLERVEMLQ
jgi:hypothetical protein